MTLINKLKKDFVANNGNPKAIIILFFFRISSFVRNSNIVLNLLFFWIRIIYKIIIQWGFGFDLPDNVIVGTPIRIFHGIALVVNSDTIIKNNVILRHSTTIGNKKSGGGSPIIGNNVDIGANSAILGEIVIGDNVIIGAGSIVTHDVPNNAIVVGNPAKIICYRNDD